MDKTWRDAKIPKWVAESITADLKKQELTIALSWPTEARPEPLPFSWGDYDRLRGEPSQGTYYSVNNDSISQVEIRPNEGLTTSWKAWAFRREGYDWSATVVRGPLFESERDARLWLLWEECERCAKELMKVRETIYKVRA